MANQQEVIVQRNPNGPGIQVQVRKTCKSTDGLTVESKLVSKRVYARIPRRYRAAAAAMGIK